jgi:23S rRNA (guanosine2251-2'-O)-methyltransferase
MAQYIYGRNTVLSAILDGKVIRVFLTPTFSDLKIREALTTKKISFEKRSADELDKLTHGVHQGVVAEIADYHYLTIDELCQKASAKAFPLLVMLDELNDPHNLGAILRSVDAFGADGLIIKKDGQVALNATVGKVSTGAIDHVPVCQVTNLSQTLKELKKKGYWAFASDGSATTDYREPDYKMPTVLIVGSEGQGVSRLVLENSDFVVKIPMVGHVNSLNASVATAVLLAAIFDRRAPMERKHEKPSK